MTLWQKAAVAGAAIGIASSAYLLWSDKEPNPEQTTASSTPLQQMRINAEAWAGKDKERDVSSLMLDLQNNRLAAVGIAKSGILVATTAGDKYFIADRWSKVSDTLLAQYHKDGKEAFPLAVIGADLTAPSFVEQYWSFLLLIGTPLIYFYYLHFGRFRVLRKGTGVTFKNVIGAHEAKSALGDVIAYLKDPKSFADMGARPPKGILLTGAPGVGKTLMAKAVAGECKVNFIAATGGDFSSKWKGDGVQKVKALFRTARRKAPCILFIDEIDGIGKRVEIDSPGVAEDNRIINQVLAEMDGFHGADGVIVMGATNFQSHLDEALTREGRFDRKVHVPLPGLVEREALFSLYMEKVKIGEDIDVRQLARMTTGMSPAAISFAVNHAALIAATAKAPCIKASDLYEAIEISQLGEQTNQTTPLKPEERRRIAVHEAGHAVIANALGVGNLEKVSILQRGDALGTTRITSEDDSRLHLQSELENRIQMLLAGRCAEQLVFDEASSGATNDLKEASKLAFHMVASMGMGVGAGSTEQLFSIQAFSDLKISSQQDAYLSDAKCLLDLLNQACQLRLSELKPALDAVTDLLLEYETITGEAVTSEVIKARGRGLTSVLCA